MNMEQRIGKVCIQSAGGTASKGAKTYKMALPTSWLNKMGVTEENRELELSFDGTQIVLTRRRGSTDWVKQRLAQKHDVRVLRFYDGDTLCSTIFADFTERTVAVENQPVPLIKTAFGNHSFPSWEDFQAFLEDRCIPRKRAGLREYLEVLGLEEYDPLSIIQKTQGRMAEDQQRLTVEVLR